MSAEQMGPQRGGDVTSLAQDNLMGLLDPSAPDCPLILTSPANGLALDPSRNSISGLIRRRSAGEAEDPCDLVSPHLAEVEPTKATTVELES